MLLNHLPYDILRYIAELLGSSSIVVLYDVCHLFRFLIKQTKNLHLATETIIKDATRSNNVHLYKYLVRIGFNINSLN